MKLRVELDREADGRWIAEVVNMPRVSGVVAYGDTREEAYEGATALALRVAAERIELKELSPAEILPLSFETA
jgi:predicted RNase H-like HicB family nuclease